MQSKVLIHLAAIVFLLLMGAAIQAQENLLTNPGFEEGFDTNGVATGWTAFTVERDDEAPSFQNIPPSYFPSSEAPNQPLLQGLPQIRTGDDAQAYGSFFETHDAGVFQQVSGITPGAEVRFSIYGYVVSTTGGDLTTSSEAGDVAIRVGIDPTGGTDPYADTVNYDVAQIFYDLYRQYSIIDTAESDTITVFVRSTVGDPVQYSFVYLDDAVLETTGETVEPEPNTDTPTPTNTATETATETATNTVTPTETATETPTNTATATSTTTPTNTPTATATEEIVEVPTNTDTPTATNTSTPTTTPTNTPTSTATNTVTPSPTPTETEEPSPTPEVIVTEEPEPTEEATEETPEPVTEAPTDDDTQEDDTDTDTEETNVFAGLPEQVTYTVQRGDTLFYIAQFFDSNVDAIIEANGLSAFGGIQVNQNLIVPVPAGQGDTPTPVPAPDTGSGGDVAASNNTYIVQRGDTLSLIAQFFDTTVGALIQLNGIANPNRILPGQVLQIPAPVQPEPVQLVEYRVRPGDTLASIAFRFGTTIRAIEEQNDLPNRNVIFVGQILNIPQP